MGLFDEFLSLAQEGKKKEDEDRAAAAAATTYQAADRKPDMEVSLRKLAGATGESPDALRDPATQASAKRAAAANEAAAAPPGTQAWLSDPQNAAIGHDDVASLSKVESALRYISNPPAFGPAYSTTGIATPQDKAKADRARAFFSSASQIPEAIGGGIAAAPSVGTLSQTRPTVYLSRSPWSFSRDLRLIASASFCQNDPHSFPFTISLPV